MTAPPTSELRPRDIVVIGASTGGVDALPIVLSQLPADLRAAVFIVQHRPSQPDSFLLEILSRASSLPVSVAEQGARHEPGNVYLAPPGVHLLLEEEHMMLSASARENRARPSVNRLFRSAAAAFGSRSVGVILTGLLDDGAAGLAAIATAGGVTIVQDPASAVAAEMPENALAAVPDARVLPLAAIGTAVVDATRTLAPPATIPEELVLEARADRGVMSPDELDRIGPRSDVSCSVCGGPLWKPNTGPLRYRCYLGHTHSPRQILDDGEVELESALWSAVRALHERGRTYETLGRDASRRGHELSAKDYEDRAREAFSDAERAREFLLRWARDRSEAVSPSGSVGGIAPVRDERERG